MILYADCYAGISGDMTVAALLDLGVPLEFLTAELQKLGLPPDSYKISTNRVERKQMSALKFNVLVNDQVTYRDYSTVNTLIIDSNLSSSVKESAQKIFRRLAEAESLVHGVPILNVHFHEVGAIDSIIDIVATAICLEYLEVKEIYISPLPLSCGFIETSHGRLSLPAPATIELLRGIPLHTECANGERVTPTGAAIVAALTAGFAKQPAMIIEKIGYGAGSHDFTDCPNILRFFLGKNIAKNNQEDQVIVVDANIDDSTPEILAFAMERLFESGALDVFFTPIQMKKNRPAVIISFLCRTDQLDFLAKVLLAETSAIGLRYYLADRITLQRQIVEQSTEYGDVHFKQVFDSRGRLLRASPEFEDCRRIAINTGIPCREVMERLQAKGAS